MHRSLRQTLVYLLTVVASQGLSFLLLPVVTRYFSPQAYGDYSLTLSISSLVGTVGSSWIRNISFRLFFDARAAGRGRSFFWTVAAAQAGAVLVLYAPTMLVLRAFTTVAPASVLVAAGAALVTSDFYGHAVGLLRAEQQTSRYSVAEISSALVRFGATIAALAAGLRSSSLLFLAPALASALLGAFATLALHRTLTGPAYFDPGVVRRLVRLGPASLPLSVSGWAERLMDRLVLDHYLTREIVGIYTANYALADRVLGGIISAVSMMAWPEIIRAWTEEGKEGAREALTRGVSLYLWLTVGPAVLVALFHRDLAVFLGPAYRGSSGIMPVVVAATWLSGVNTYLNRHLELGLRFGRLSAVAIGGATLNLLMNFVLVPRLGALGGALATLVNFLATALVFWVTRDRDLVRLPTNTLADVAMLVVAALLLSRVPADGLQRPAVFAAVYASGASWFVLRRFRRKQLDVA
jgi:O-antigen/teichoic acid export membrane protein